MGKNKQTKPSVVSQKLAYYDERARRERLVDAWVPVAAVVCVYLTVGLLWVSGL